MPTEGNKFREAELDKSKSSRRKILKAGGVTIASTIGVASTKSVSGKSNDEIPEKVKEQLRRRYGNEAEILINIISEVIRKVDSGVLSEDQGNTRVNNRIIEHPKTPKATSDIQSVAESHSPSSDPIVDTQTTSEVSTSKVSTSSFSLIPDEGEAGGSSSLTGAAERDYNVSQNTVRANARVALAGDATGYARVYASDVYLSGDVRVSATYYRAGTVQGGSAEISLFVRDSNGTLIDQVVERPSGVDGTTTEYAQFYLEEGESYDIGIEVYTRVSGLNSYSYADFYSLSTVGQRRVELNGGLDIETLG
ncbi:hypothetical protein [Haloarchaeobius sp. DFWS5]|uniref:hypothetical protein n=1 Tax=Haloarchaeobius sp. DFWS5 TaxID=3446114 RepID=UPI003EB81FE1